MYFAGSVEMLNRHLACVTQPGARSLYRQDARTTYPVLVVCT